MGRRYALRDEQWELIFKALSQDPDNEYVMRSNQLRVLLAALGYVLIERLLKVAAVVTRNTRRIRLYLASNWPSVDIFAHAMRMLGSP